MSAEQLPDGLQLAVNELLKLAESNRDMGPLDQGSFFDRRALTLSISADAIRAEHAQRVTLQHHAADMAQRVADLEAERDQLRKDVHDLNWALGMQGYETMSDPADQAASDAAHAAALANIERMKARKDRHNALLPDGADPLDEIERLRVALRKIAGIGEHADAWADIDAAEIADAALQGDPK